MDWIGQLRETTRLQLLAPTDNISEVPSALLQPTNVIVSQHVPVTTTFIEDAPHLGLIQRYKTRADGIDLQAAKEAGVVVATMPLHGCIAVAELAMTFIPSLSKCLVRDHQSTVSGAYRALGIEPIRTEQRVHKFQWMKIAGLL